MSKAMGRKISLRTAICEYFCSVHKTLRNPKVVEIHLFEKTLKDSKENSQIIGERVRKGVEELTIKWNDADIKLTISGGLSAFPEEADSVTALIQTADEAVQRAKDMGKNRVL
jgi:GGDEF domain-containing protein